MEESTKKKKPGTDNVIPANRRTHEENVANGRKGGLKAAENRKERMLFKEAIEKQLGDSLENIVAALMKKAARGDVPASVFLRDTIGEKPTDKIEADLDNHVDIQIKIDDEE